MAKSPALRALAIIFEKPPINRVIPKIYGQQQPPFVVMRRSPIRPKLKAFSSINQPLKTVSCLICPARTFNDINGLERNARINISIGDYLPEKTFLGHIKNFSSPSTRSEGMKLTRDSHFAPRQLKINEHIVRKDDKFLGFYDLG